MAIIKELEDTVNILKDKFAVSITNKMHIITTHVPEYIEETRLSLGQTSDQIIESSHQYVNKRFMDSNYFVKNVENYDLVKDDLVFNQAVRTFKITDEIDPLTK